MNNSNYPNAKLNKAPSGKDIGTMPQRSLMNFQNISKSVDKQQKDNNNYFVNTQKDKDGSHRQKDGTFTSNYGSQVREKRLSQH